MLRLPTETPNIDKLLNIDPEIIIQYGEIDKIQSVATDLGYGNFSHFLDRNEINKMYRVLVLSQLLIQAYQKLQLEQINEIQKINDHLTKLEAQKDKQLQEQRLELEKCKEVITQLNNQLELLRDNQKYITENNNVVEELNSVKQVQQLIAQSQISIIEAQKQALSMQVNNQRKISSPPPLHPQPDPLKQTLFQQTQDKRNSIDTTLNSLNAHPQNIRSPREYETSELEGSFINNQSSNQVNHSIQPQNQTSVGSASIHLSAQNQQISLQSQPKNTLSPYTTHRNRQLVAVKKYRHVDRHGNVWPLPGPRTSLGQ